MFRAHRKNQGSAKVIFYCLEVLQTEPMHGIYKESYFDWQRMNFLTLWAIPQQKRLLEETISFLTLEAFDEKLNKRISGRLAGWGRRVSSKYLHHGPLISKALELWGAIILWCRYVSGVKENQDSEANLCGSLSDWRKESEKENLSGCLFLSTCHQLRFGLNYFPKQMDP